MALANAAPVFALSLDFLVQVLCLLPSDERARAACVCRTWRDAAAEPEALASLWFDENRPWTLSDAVLARLCARAGEALREVRLDAAAGEDFTQAGAVAALSSGGCRGVKRLVVETRDWWQDTVPMSAEQAQQLATACLALEYAACGVRCERPEDVATVCALLPGPLTLYIDRWVGAAQAALKLPAQVEVLRIRNCNLRDEQDALGEALRTNATLTTLLLESCAIGDAGAASLGKALLTNATLVSLHMSGLYIGDAGVAALSEALRTNATLTSLNLNSNGISAEAAASLGEALRTNTTLTTLSLGTNDIGAAGAASLAEVLRTNATLTTLHLHLNVIGDAGAIALGEALRVNATLTELDLSHNGIRDAGAAALGDALRTNDTLTSLTLSGNQISDSAADALFETLRLANVTLTTLRLGDDSSDSSDEEAEEGEEEEEDDDDDDEEEEEEEEDDE